MLVKPVPWAWCSALLCGVLISVVGSRETVPSLEIEDDAVYHGLIKENEVQVELSPTIRTIENGPEICSYRIVNKRHGEVPFHIRVLDKRTGQAVMEATRKLNCEKRKTYKFDIAAVSCDNEISDSVMVRITVVDVNEYEPYFEKEHYMVEADEGRLYDKLLTVRATDDDCSPNFGDICKYEILTPDQPFVIDAEGNIKNIRALNWNNRNHILAVAASDCGLKKSKSVMVTIKVNRVCNVGWKGVGDELEYVPGSPRRYLGENAHLDLCDKPCEVDQIKTTVALTTRHIGKGCYRDTYSVKSQRKLCGANDEELDLLPTAGIGAEWTRDLPTDEGQESDQIYSFDGKTNSVIIPESVLTHDLTQNFTVSTWMKHDTNMTNKKEHIICNSDDHKMNRHHWSLFVRNCRLILLIRRDFSDQNLNTFRPAEWRWKLAEVCDNEWHQYTVNFNFPTAKLFVDGREFNGGDKNPEVIDDWPLHPTKDIKTTTVVGGCWQGSKNHVNQYFRGFLAGLTVLRGKTEGANVIKCLHSCKESLDFQDPEDILPGTETTFNGDMSEIGLTVGDQAHMDLMMRKVSYVNTRQFPTPGRRAITIDTQVTCKNDEKVKVSKTTTYIRVLHPEKPVITITGTPNTAKEYEELEKGVKVFADIGIAVTYDSQLAEATDDKTTESKSASESNLDSCTVLVDPPLNPDHEYFTVPTNLIETLHLGVKQTGDGIVISGADKVYTYEDILRQVHYFNTKPAFYLSRTFKVSCSELSGRYSSNEFKTEVSVIHTEPKEPVPAHVQHEAAQSVEMKPLFGMDNNGVPALSLGSGSINEVSNVAPNHAVAVIIVVCVGFLVFMIVLGIIRIRAAHQRAQSEDEEKQEMAWDDSPLTITINPMQQLQEVQAGCGDEVVHEEDSCSEDDDSIDYNDEDISSEDDEEEEYPATKKDKRDLEWDDSTLSF